MNKGQWGRIIAAVAAIVIIALVAVYLFARHTKPEATTSAAPRAASRDQAAASGSESTASNTGNGSESTSSSTGAASSPGSTTSHATAGTASATTTAGAKSAEAPAAGESEAALQKEAESYVKQLTQSSKEPLEVGNAEGFVKGNRPLELKQSESGTNTNAAGAPATEAKESEPLVAGESGQAASLSATAATESRQEKAPGTATAAEPRQAASPAAAVAGSSAPQAAKSMAAGESSEANSLQAASAAGAPASASAENDVKSAQQIRVDLPVNEQSPITIADIIGAGADVPPDAVYYVHTVKSKDDQGIWGIVQSGVVENFAEGVAVRHGGSSHTYRVDIPHDADELRPDHSSSFLGRLIYEKSRESYVYNFKTGRIGKNPNLIKPGQEIVIVSFTPEELIEIYKHFVYQHELGQGTTHS
ncbi:MAG: hypothetical protein WB783_20410 [Arenicellales bacterium]